MRALCIIVTGLAMLDVCFGRSWPFSASQNLTIMPYKPYQSFWPAQYPSFRASASLYNGSYFKLGPALLQTYNYPIYRNYTVSMPEVVYDGPKFTTKSFVFKKDIDPCFLMVNQNYEVNFPDAWTNSVQGYFEITASQISLSNIFVNRGWIIEDYARWDIPKNNNYTKLYLDIWSLDTLSDLIKSISFRHIGSKSCTLGLDPTTEEDLSFSIDFSTSHVTHRTVILDALPSNTSFIVHVERISSKFPYIELLSPSKEFDYSSAQLPFIELYWTYIVSASLSVLLLLSSSIAIIVLKCRQRRTQRREQYENIPDQSVDDRYDNEQQHLIVSS